LPQANPDTLRETLRANLVRLWLHLGREARPPDEERVDEKLRAALEELLQRSGSTVEVLRFADQTPETRLVSRFFPGGLPAFEVYNQLAERALPVSQLEYACALIVGSSPAIRESIETALRLAPTSAPVFICGETGVGKELAARLVHHASHLAAAPLVIVNCAAMPETLLLSELFGYEPGAFTGAAPRGRQGKIEAADGGTLILDEIGELPPSGQAALLRFLDSGEIQKIGRVQPHRVSVRLICTTHRRLDELAEQGAFRKDLYYRIALVTLRIPSLRERLSDLPDLVRHFVCQFQEHYRRARPNRASDDALDRLARHSWPGNVRELRFTLERAFLLCTEDAIEPRHISWPDQVAIGGCEAGAASVEQLIAARLGEVRASLFRDRERWARFLASHTGRSISAGQVAREFQMSEASVRIRLAALVQLGILAAEGERKGRKYHLLPPFAP